jgi:hypothetical protein
VFGPCRSALVGPDHHSAKKVLILTMKFWKMKKSDFDHEKMYLVEKNVGTPAILGSTLGLVRLSEESRSDLVLWLIQNIGTAVMPLERAVPTVQLTSDASKSGWGGFREGFQATGDRWSQEEAEEHINYLELLGGFFTLSRPPALTVRVCVSD